MTNPTPSPDVAELVALSEALEAERQAYRLLVEQHAQTTGQKVGYVTQPAALSVALNRYRSATEPDRILALARAYEALRVERDTLHYAWLNEMEKRQQAERALAAARRGRDAQREAAEHWIGKCDELGAQFAAARAAMQELSAFASNECTCDIAWKGRGKTDPQCCYCEFEHEILAIRAALKGAPDA